jgi:hypothetical protein
VGEQNIRTVGKSDQVHHEIIAGTVGQDDVNLQVQLSVYLVVGKDAADVDRVEAS